MPVTPYQLDLWSSNMSHIYQSLEGEILKIIIKQLNTNPDNIQDWQRQKLNDLKLINKDTAKVVSDATGLSQKQIENIFGEVGPKIIKDVDGTVPYDNLPLPTDLDNIMRAYYEQAWGDVDNYVNQTLISTNNGYRTAITAMYTDIINKTTAGFNSGLFTFEEALEKTVQKWAQKGINSSFIDKGGHSWSLERYVRTVLKSTLGNTYNQLRKDRMAEYDVHTVLVTSHMGARAACSKIQGNVVDLRETVPAKAEYRSIYDSYWNAEYGTAGGHRGVNCTHNHIPFIPGVNTNNQTKYNASENEKVAKLTKRQRELERRIVKLKKNKMVSESMDNTDGAKIWQRDITATQRAIRELVDSNEYLSRNYAREKVYTPLDLLVKDFRYDE